MRVIIAGSRTVHENDVQYHLVCEAIRQSGFNPSLIVSGGCRGVDRLGEIWAENNGVPLVRYPAPWGTAGRAAGPIRNERMATHADALVAVWDGVSKGTQDMINRAKAHGLKVFIQAIDHGSAIKRQTVLTSYSV